MYAWLYVFCYWYVYDVYSATGTYVYVYVMLFVLLVLVRERIPVWLSPCRLSPTGNFWFSSHSDSATLVGAERKKHQGTSKGDRDRADQHHSDQRPSIQKHSLQVTTES